jgi:hypothetical protein
MRARIVTSYAMLGLIFVAFAAQADPVKCEKGILGQLLKFKKVILKTHEKCLDNENLSKIPGPCPDATASLKITSTDGKVDSKIVGSCPDPSDIAAYTTCNFKPGATGKEADCAGLPVATPQNLADCLECWKTAELKRFVAIAYASHAAELCAADPNDPNDPLTAKCSPMACSSPRPLQKDLGSTGEDDCQRAIGKAGFKYLLSKEKVLEKCGLAGGTRATCLDTNTAAGAKVAVAILKAEQQKAALIKNKCGNNRSPVANPPFCCKTGTGNACTVVATRADCTMIVGAAVQEGKVCDMGSCSPTPGSQTITWWENCPNASCGSSPLATLTDLIACVDSSADSTIDDLLCQQFASGWCSPSGAFLE